VKLPPIGFVALIVKAKPTATLEQGEHQRQQGREGLGFVIYRQAQESMQKRV
jgi:hypothetical protein